MERTFVDKFNEYVKRISKEHENGWDIIKQNNLRKAEQNHPAQIIEIIEKYSRHVAWIRVKKNGRLKKSGTFFLLTKSLGLTCYDVVKDVRKSCKHNNYRIEIRNAYTQRGAEDWYSLPAKMVKYSKSFNYAFLHVKINYFPESPRGLLQHLTLPPQDGHVTIIGHPQDQYNQINVCSVLNIYDRDDSYPPPFVHVLTQCSLRKLFSSESKTNKSCLYEEASGAPMFNNGGELVAMHSGVYTVDASATTKHVIEYGRSMVDIIIKGAIKIEDLRCEFFQLLLGNKDLRSYIFSSSHPSHMEKFVTRLKQLWDVKRNAEYPENDEEKDECKLLPLKLTAEFTINNEDDLNNVLETCGHYNSQRASILRKLTSPGLYDEETPEPSHSITPGCYKCPPGTCDVCLRMKEGSSFISYQTKKSYHMAQSINCNSTYVVYVISCTECKLQYVGSTERKLETRIWEHISEGRSSVSKHFMDKHQRNLEYFQFQGIQMMENPEEYMNSKRVLENLEAVWIWRLQTVEPRGLNKKNACLRFHTCRKRVDFGEK